MKIKLTIAFIMLFLSSLSLMAQNNSLFQKEVFVQKADTLQYRVMFPKDFSDEKQYPVVLFLHGAGERGNDNEMQLLNGSSLFKNEINREKYPAIILFPQCPKNEYWSNVKVDRSTYPINLGFQYEKGATKPMELVIQLIEEFQNKSFVLKNQIYVMGLSMGGMGTFEILYRKPNLFAAAIPICGAGDTQKVNVYAKNVPLWVFHGAKDNVVNPLESVNLVNALLNAGAYPKFTLYDFANHNSWDSAFSEKELLSWLFSKQKSKNK